MFVRLPFKINVNIVIILMSKETEFHKISTSLFRLLLYLKYYEEVLTQWLHNSLKKKLSHPHVSGKYLWCYSVTLASFGPQHFLPGLCFPICFRRSSLGDPLYLFISAQRGSQALHTPGGLWLIRQTMYLPVVLSPSLLLIAS